MNKIINLVYIFIGAMIYECIGASGAERFTIIKEHVDKDEVIKTCNESIDGSFTVNPSFKFSFFNRNENITNIDMKKISICAVISIALGTIVSVIYLAATDLPSALYGDREKDEAGKSLGVWSGIFTFIIGLCLVKLYNVFNGKKYEYTNEHPEL